MNQVIWTDRALANLGAIQAYIEQFNPSAASAVAAELIAAGNSLQHLPHRGRPVPQTDVRELVTTYPYVIRYQVVGNDVVVLRVRHVARRPTNP